MARLTKLEKELVEQALRNRITYLANERRRAAQEGDQSLWQHYEKHVLTIYSAADKLKLTP